MGKLEIREAVNSIEQTGVGIDERFAAYVDGITGLWIPPSTGTEETKWFSPHVMDPRVNEACRILGTNDLGNHPELVSTLGYPVTDELRKKLWEGSDPDFNSPGFHQSLMDKGWKHKNPDAIDHKRLVTQFLALGEISSDDLLHRVREFVLRWGPLWSCASHTDCNWGPSTYSFDSWRYRFPCTWYCNEPAILFQARARQAAAAIEIAGYLARKEPAPLEDWRQLSARLGLHEIANLADGRDGTVKRTRQELFDLLEVELSVQRRHLMWAVDRFIGGAQGPRFRLFWSQREGRPKMLIDTGLGFLRLVWLQIAQNLSGFKGIYKCDACTGYYVAERKPPDGRHHFCPKCGGAGKRGSKKLWARLNRKVRNAKKSNGNARRGKARRAVS